MKEEQSMRDQIIDVMKKLGYAVRPMEITLELEGSDLHTAEKVRNELRKMLQEGIVQKNQITKTYFLDKN